MTNSTIWDNVWIKKSITSDYSLKYIDYINTNIIPNIPKNSKILEAGCGTGQTLNLFNHCNTTGIDISKIALNLSKINCDHQVLGNILSMPFKSNSFDLTYNSGVIEHFPDPLNDTIVKEMIRITKPGGKILIIAPNSFCLWYRFGKFFANLTNNFEFGYEEDYSISRLSRLFVQNECKISNIFGLQALPPFATNNKELLREPLRQKIGSIEKYLPYKEYYGYAVGVIGEKQQHLNI